MRQISIQHHLLSSDCKDSIFDFQFIFYHLHSGINIKLHQYQKRGRELGRAEGLAEGRAEGRAETVKKMLAAGISVEMIANALGMSVEEIESL